MQSHTFHTLANYRQQDMQRSAQHQRLVNACRQDQKRKTASHKGAKPKRFVLRQQGRAAPTH